MTNERTATGALAAYSAKRDEARARLEREVVELFEQFRSRLLRYLATFGLPVQDGEEVIQEVFLALFQHLARGKSRENLRAWLFRVAHNLALQRRVKTLRAVDAMDGEFESTDPAPSAEARMIDAQSRQRVRAVVAALGEQDRSCLALRAEGLRYREIAKILEISLGAVSISLARSLARIARAVER